jgi:glutamate racemase
MTRVEYSQLPIGVFDSGVGGLTVLKAIREVLPRESLLYLGDTARLPYGTKSPTSISRYAAQATAQLVARGVKLLVVACNTASAVALESLRESMVPVPVIGVIEPGASAAVAARPGGRHRVLATEATVRLGAYARAIKDRDVAATITEQACELLVSVAEEGWTSGDIAESIVRRYLHDLATGPGVDTIILGCTHFPLLRDVIANVVGDSVLIVDSASTTAASVREALANKGLLNDAAATGSLHLMATDGRARFARVGGQFLGQTLTQDDIELVDL